MMKLLIVAVCISSLACALPAYYNPVPLNNIFELPQMYGQYGKRGGPRSFNDAITAIDMVDGYMRMFRPRVAKTIRADSKHPLCFFTGLPCAMH